MRACDNPFRTERVLQVRYRLQGVTWEELLDRYESLRYRAALIGPHGCGKTTLLETLEPRLRERGFATRFVRLNEEKRSLAPRQMAALRDGLAPNVLLLVDGAEQLRPLAWLWFQWRTRKAGGWLITTHRPGRLPTLWECRTSPDLLAGIASELLAADRPGIHEQARALFDKHRGNLREALWEWYDQAYEHPTEAHPGGNARRAAA